jgi:quercetin dioxygenase-like cupin family protein
LSGFVYLPAYRSFAVVSPSTYPMPAAFSELPSPGVALEASLRDFLIGYLPTLKIGDMSLRLYKDANGRIGRERSSSRCGNASWGGGRSARKGVHMKATRITGGVALLIGSGLALHLALAQEPGIRRTELQRHDLGVPGREVVQVRVEFDPEAAFGRHRHPGEEIAYVLEGALEYQVQGRPPTTLEAGDVLFIPAGTIHSAKNVGSNTGAELATCIVEKGKPLVEMVK